MARVIEKTKGKIRSLPISAQLRTILERAARDCNVTVHVTSGGQPPAPGKPRTGSTRHDVGGSRMGAADLMMIRNGVTLDMRKAADQAVMGKFVRLCVTAGAVGVGAGVSYMGAHTVHIGGGTAAVWGAASGPTPAPHWIRTEHAAGMIERRR